MNCHRLQLRLLLPLFLGLFLGIFSSHAYAQVNPSDILPTPPQVFDNINNPSSTTALSGDTSGTEGQRNLLNEGPIVIMNYIFGSFTAIGIVVAVIAGARLSFSYGDPKKMQQSIMAIVYVAIGMVIIGMSWVAIRLVLSINLGT